VHGGLPVGAIRETSAKRTVWDALENPKKRAVVQVAPAVRVALGEEFGLPAGTRVTGKLAAALRKLGFKTCLTPTSRRTSPSWKRAPSF
jgi:iron only hydrogenase large subunit-like protein